MGSSLPKTFSLLGTISQQTSPFQPDVSTEFLLARLAWAILPQGALILETYHPRAVLVRDRDPTAEHHIETEAGWKIVSSYIMNPAADDAGIGSVTSKRRKPSGQDMDVMSDVNIEDQMHECEAWLKETDDSCWEDVIAIDSPPVPHSAKSVPLSTA